MFFFYCFEAVNHSTTTSHPITSFLVQMSNKQTIPSFMLNPVKKDGWIKNFGFLSILDFWAYLGMTKISVFGTSAYYWTSSSRHNRWGKKFIQEHFWGWHTENRRFVWCHPQENLSHSLKKLWFSVIQERHICMWNKKRAKVYDVKELF